MAIIKNRFTDGNRDEWLAIRNQLKAEHRHGGSDTGKIFGANSYESAFAYFQKCTGALPPDDPNMDNEAMRQGRDGEQYVADRFMELTGKHCHVENCVFTNDEFGQFFATIDRKVDNEDAGLECKNHKDTVIGKYRNNDLPFPTSHFYQVMVYMMVCGFSRYYLAIRIYGTGFKVYYFTRHADDIKPEWAEAMYTLSDDDFNAVAKRVNEFNEMVAGGEWLWGFDGSASTSAAQSQMFTGKLTDTVDMTGKLSLVKAIKIASENVKNAEEEEERLKQELRQYLGEHGAIGGKACDGEATYTVSYKDQQTNRLNADCIKAALGTDVPPEFYKTTTSPVLRISVNKVKKQCTR